MVQASRRKYHYIYKTTCSITNKFYIGMHSTDDLNDGYVGSGKLLWHSIRKHGKENHNTEILELLPSRLKLKEREAVLVGEELINDPLCLNIQHGGGGGWDHLSEDEFLSVCKLGAERFTDRFRNEPEFKAHITNAQSKGGKANYERNGSRIQNFRYDWNGKTHNEESKQKMREAKIGAGLAEQNSQFGTCWIYNVELRQNRKIDKNDLPSWLDAGWVKGRKIQQK